MGLLKVGRGSKTVPERVATPGAAIQVVDLVRRFPGGAGVRGVSLNIGPGEIVSIIGPSGAGKSTLLRCINYLDEPEEGTIRVGDLVLTAGRSHGRAQLERLRTTIGMVFQSFNLFPHLTVLRNVSLAQQRVLGCGRREADERSRELLDRVGLLDKIDDHPDRCSGGERQRVAIARALALEPQAMLFDEPTSSLDPELGLEVLRVMEQLAGDGMTMLVVTHELHFARAVSDRVAVMADGQILEEGSPDSVFQMPRQERTARFLSAVTYRDVKRQRAHLAG